MAPSGHDRLKAGRCATDVTDVYFCMCCMVKKIWSSHELNAEKDLIPSTLT